MATVKSTQKTNRDATPIVKLDPMDVGKVKVAFFEYTTPTGNLAIGDVIELVVLPANVRILTGYAAWEAMSSGAAVADVIIGISGATSRYLGVTSVDAAGSADFANTIALNFGDKRTAETTIIATAGTEAWIAAKKFFGYVLYVDAG